MNTYSGDGTPVHIYTSSHQPATRFEVGHLVGDTEEWIEHRPHKLVFTWCCGVRRWAGHCSVQVYYDSLRFWCCKGKGCKA